MTKSVLRLGLRDHFLANQKDQGIARERFHELIATYVRQIEVRRTAIAISLLNEENASEDEQDNPLVLTVPWSKTPHRRHRDVIAPEGPSRTQVPPIRSDTRTKLVTAIARGRQWLSEIEAGAVTIDGIATREACSQRAFGSNDVAMASMRRLAPRHGEDEGGALFVL
jgi:hypothetical protein